MERLPPFLGWDQAPAPIGMEQAPPLLGDVDTAPLPTTGQVYSATYGNTPVYEIHVGHHVVMREQSENYINASHILTVAGLEKPARTKVLEKQLPKADCKKKQGGYGKFQGTWVPLAVGRELAVRHFVLDKIAPLLDYVPGLEPLPPAPKHRQGSAEDKSRSKPARRKKMALAKPTPTHPPQTAHMTRETQTYTTVYGPPLGGPPQDIASVLAQRGGRCAVLRRDGRVSFMEAPYTETNYSGMSEEDGHVSGDLLPADEPLSSDLPPPGYLNLPIDKQQADIMCYPRRLLDYYMGTYGTTTPLKAPQPPPGFDVNKILTRKGHTLLHLAASMGDIVSVKHLLELGADPHAGLIEEVVDADTPNGVIKRRTGATPLMYAAQFTNNYERRTMEALFQTMAITLVQKDEYGNTILHYAANLTENLGFQRCAAYYLEAIAYWLKMTCDSAPFTEHVDLRNRKGDTALIIVAKNRARLAINSLLGCGASEHIPDRDGKSADIYLWEAIRATENDQAARSSMSEEGPPASESSVVEAIRDNVEPDVAVTFAKDVEKWQHEEAEKDAEIQGLQSTREQLQEAADETRLMLANVSQEVDLGRATEPAEVQELTELQRDYEAHNRALSDYWVAFTNKRKESQLAPSQRVPQVPSTDEDLQERLDGVDSLRRQRDVHGAQVAQMLPAEHVAAVGEDGETAHYKELFKLGAGLGAEDNVDQLGPIFLEELQAEKEMREGCERLRKQASGAHGDPAGGAHGGNTD